MSSGRFPARAPALLAVLLAALALGACGAQARGETAPGVLLIVIDGLRADHLGVYGYDRDTSPALSELARDGVRFEQVFASAPQLIPAHVALLTGCEPILARRFLEVKTELGRPTPSEIEGPSERRWLVPSRGVHLAVEFLAQGYATAAFVDHEYLGPSQGFAQGFQRYEVLDPGGAEEWEGRQTNRIVEHFLQWLRELPQGRPWFAYLHLNQLERCWTDPSSAAESFFQPRASLSDVPPVASTDAVFFAVPRSHWRGGPRTLGQYEALYDDEIRSLDKELERLFDSLRRMGRSESTGVHVVGSFGMQMGESGLYLTAGRYSQADLSVPWIFRPRAEFAGARGRTVPGLVSTLDVAPTLLDLAGLTVPSVMSGRSQAAVARDRSAPAAERDFVYASCGLQGGFSVIGARHVLEYLLAEGSEDASLRRSWFGEWTDYERRLGIRFYPRARLASPPLEVESPARNEEEFDLFRDEALRWRSDTSDARHFLQAPPGRSGLDDDALRRLRERGYGRPSQ